VQEKPVGVETGQLPSKGHWSPASPASAGPTPDVQWAATQVWPSGQTVPQAPQFFESVVLSEQLPLQFEGALAGQFPTQPYVPPTPMAQRPASPSHALPQAPQLEMAEGSAQLPLHDRRPAGQPASAPPSSPG
jgi:hypothetical protein